MAGSAPRGRGGSPQSPHSDWARLEAAILSGWRSFWQSVGKERAAPRASPEEAAEEASALTRLPVSGGHRPRSRRAGPGGGASPGGLGAGASPRPTLWLAASLQPVCRRRRLGAAVARKRPGVAPWCCAAAGGRSETRPAGALVPSRVTLRVPAPRCGLGAATPRTSGQGSKETVPASLVRWGKRPVSAFPASVILGSVSPNTGVPKTTLSEALAAFIFPYISSDRTSTQLKIND